MTDARSVSIDSDAIAELAQRLAAAPAAPGWDKSVHFADGGPLTAQYLLVLDALNFCFWPDPGLGYSDLALGLRAAVIADPSGLDAERLSQTTAADIALWFGRPVWNADERARLVRGLAERLLQGYGGRASELIVSACGSADALVERIVTELPGFDDSATLDGRTVCFHKRAQIYVADVWGAFGGRGLGAFHDIEALTMFADYRVPQLLRHVGVLRYAPELAAEVDAETELPAGGREEIEIRSATVQAVERLRTALDELGRRVNSVELDWRLWHMAEDGVAETGIGPHHRVRTIAY